MSTPIHHHSHHYVVLSGSPARQPVTPIAFVFCEYTSNPRRRTSQHYWTATVPSDRPRVMTGWVDCWLARNSLTDPHPPRPGRQHGIEYRMPTSYGQSVTRPTSQQTGQMFQIERVGERRCMQPHVPSGPAVVTRHRIHRMASPVQPSVPLQLQPQICRPGKTICLPAARTVRWRVLLVCTYIRATWHHGNRYTRHAHTISPLGMYMGTLRHHTRVYPPPCPDVAPRSTTPSRPASRERLLPCLIHRLITSP